MKRFFTKFCPMLSFAALGQDLPGQGDYVLATGGTLTIEQGFC
jgi:hypothetical protein